MRIAKVENNFVSDITISNDFEHSADWLMEKIGGQWINLSEESVVEIGYEYKPNLENFIPPKPMPSTEQGIIDWTLNEETLSWEPVSEA